MTHITRCCDGSRLTEERGACYVRFNDLIPLNPLLTLPCSRICRVAS